ncbi:MAG: hypothetical protein ACQERN_14330 [Thermodesulfobacteriota bacterium]
MMVAGIFFFRCHFLALAITGGIIGLRMVVPFALGSLFSGDLFYSLPIL